MKRIEDNRDEDAQFARVCEAFEERGGLSEGRATQLAHDEFLKIFLRYSNLMYDILLRVA